MFKCLNNIIELQDKSLKYALGEANHRFMYSDSDLRKLREHYELLLELTPRYIDAPCRKCPACLKKRENEWRGRLLRETDYWFSQNKKVLFVTLSYKNVNGARSHYKHDLAVFFDKLRSKFRRSIRHWCIPELGENTGRFHIHALLFDVPDELAPDSHFHRSKNGAIMGSNAIIKECWSKGIVDVGFLKEYSGASYVVSYLTKFTDAQLKANNGLPFKGGIVSSNKMGFLSYDEKKMFDDVRKCLSPTYFICGFIYSLPMTLLRRYLNPIKLRYVSFNNDLKRQFAGGRYVYNKKHYDNPYDYMAVLRTAVGATAYSHTLHSSYKDVNSIQQNEFFDFEDLI